MRNIKDKAVYVLMAFLCCAGLAAFGPVPLAHGQEATPKLWLASGIPQRLQGEDSWQQEYWQQKYGAIAGNGLYLPNVVPEREGCWQVKWPAYYGIVDLPNGYLQLTKCIPEETMNSSDTITAAVFSTTSGPPVYIAINSGWAYWDANPIYIITASKPLSQLLPPGFSAQSFARPGAQFNIKNLVVFYLELELPRQGTDVLAHIRLLPIGLQVDKDSPAIAGEDLLTKLWPWRPDHQPTEVPETLKPDVPYVANADKTLFYAAALAPYNYGHASVPPIVGVTHLNMSDMHLALEEIAFEGLMPKPWPQMTTAEKQILAQRLAQLPALNKLPAHDFIAQMDYLYMLESAWSQLKWETLVLGWDKELLRFYIKGGQTPARPANFISYYLSPNPAAASPHAVRDRQWFWQ